LVSRLLKQKSIANNWLTKSQYYNFEKQYLYAILIDQNILKSKIGTRLKDRFNSGLIQEIDKYKYLGEQKFMALGLEYRQTWLYMNSKISLDQLQTNLLNQNLQYAKRQLTWLKNQKNLIWIKNLEQLIQDLDLG
jgi:tRNA dimethylallyltransferase